MLRKCEYRLPCDRCDKFDSFCDLTYDQLKISEKLSVFIVIRTTKNNEVKQDIISSVHLSRNAAEYKKELCESKAKQFNFAEAYRVEEWVALDD